MTFICTRISHSFAPIVHLAVIDFYGISQRLGVQRIETGVQRIETVMADGTMYYGLPTCSSGI